MSSTLCKSCGGTGHVDKPQVEHQLTSWEIPLLPLYMAGHVFDDLKSLSSNAWNLSKKTCNFAISSIGYFGSVVKNHIPSKIHLFSKPTGFELAHTDSTPSVFKKCYDYLTLKKSVAAASVIATSILGYCFRKPIENFIETGASILMNHKVIMGAALSTIAITPLINNAIKSDRSSSLSDRSFSLKKFSINLLSSTFEKTKNAWFATKGAINEVAPKIKNGSITAKDSLKRYSYYSFNFIKNLKPITKISAIGIPVLACLAYYLKPTVQKSIEVAKSFKIRSTAIASTKFTNDLSRSQKVLNTLKTGFDTVKGFIVRSKSVPIAEVKTVATSQKILNTLKTGLETVKNHNPINPSNPFSQGIFKTLKVGVPIVVGGYLLYKITPKMYHYITNRKTFLGSRIMPIVDKCARVLKDRPSCTESLSKKVEWIKYGVKNLHPINGIENCAINVKDLSIYSISSIYHHLPSISCLNPLSLIGKVTNFTTGVFHRKRNSSEKEIVGNQEDLKSNASQKKFQLHSEVNAILDKIETDLHKLEPDVHKLVTDLHKLETDVNEGRDQLHKKVENSLN